METSSTKLSILKLINEEHQQGGLGLPVARICELSGLSEGEVMSALELLRQENLLDETDDVSVVGLSARGLRAAKEICLDKDDNPPSESRKDAQNDVFSQTAMLVRNLLSRVPDVLDETALSDTEKAGLSLSVHVMLSCREFDNILELAARDVERLGNK